MQEGIRQAIWSVVQVFRERFDAERRMRSPDRNCRSKPMMYMSCLTRLDWVICGSYTASVERDDLKFSPYKAFHTQGFFKPLALTAIFLKRSAKKYFLLHQPYDSFNPVWISLRRRRATLDVLAIKQTIYRIGKTAVIDALIEAPGRAKKWPY